MGEVYKYLSGYHGNTAVGVVMMPVEHFTLVSTLQFESHGTLDCHRASFWASDIFCSNFDFGPFNFVKPLIDTVQDPLITEIIHRETNLTASLPHGLRIPTSQIGNDDGQFALARWAFASTTLLKGPGALSLQVLKLYGKSDQRKILRCERHYDSMLVTPQMETIALTPPPEQPDMILRLWQDKKVRKAAGDNDAVAVRDNQTPRHADAVPADAVPAVEDQEEDQAPLHPVQRMAAAQGRRRALANEMAAALPDEALRDAIPALVDAIPAVVDAIPALADAIPALADAIPAPANANAGGDIAAPAGEDDDDDEVSSNFVNEPEVHVVETSEVADDDNKDKESQQVNVEEELVTTEKKKKRLQLQKFDDAVKLVPLPKSRLDPAVDSDADSKDAPTSTLTKDLSSVMDDFADVTDPDVTVVA